MVLACACSPQCGRSAKQPLTTPVAAKPTPSPSPTPTAPLQASSPPFHGGEVGVPYTAVALAVTGGVAPYRWSVSSGALPDGVVVGSDGSVAGSPTTAGTFSFTIQAADSGDSTASLSGTITIAARLSVSLIPACAQYCNVELGCASGCGSFGQVSGGVGPYAYAVSQGPLPAGTSLSGLSLTGTFTGLSGWLQFTIQVTDAYGAAASLAPKFWMYDHVSLASGSCSGNYGSGCAASLPISGGVAGTNRTVKLVSIADNPSQGCWPKQAGPAPQGYSLSVVGGNVEVRIPNRILNGYGAVWTLQVDEQTPCATGTDCTSNLAQVVIGVRCG
jgi:hypothetical protein